MTDQLNPELSKPSATPPEFDQEAFNAKFPPAPLSEKEFQDHFMAKANKVKTMEDFQALYKEVVEFKHDYGTIVHGCAVVMKAAFTLLNNSPTGGITGFQSGCLSWMMVREFKMVGKGPLSLIDYENLLYPQDSDKFEKIISSSTHKWLQESAAEKLKESPNAHPSVLHHWKSIVDGVVPFGFTVREE